MLEKGKAGSLLRELPWDGNMVKLRNGDEFLVPVMPIGPSGKKFAKMLDDLDGLNLMSEAGQDKAFEFVHQVLTLNYPELTLDDCDGLFDVRSFWKLVPAFFGAPAESDSPAQPPVALPVPSEPAPAPEPAPEAAPAT